MILASCSPALIKALTDVCITSCTGPLLSLALSSIGTGVKEIRVKDAQGIFRIIYVVKYLNRVNVLHAFQKKTEKTAKKDIDLAKQRLKLILEGIKNGK